MVGDLVVVDVVDIDALRSLAHLLGDDRGVEIALQDIGGGAKSGVGPSPVNSRQDVEPVLSGSLPSLLRPPRRWSVRPRGVKPLGLVRNQANVCRAAADPRPPPRRLIVSTARGASPVKRFPRASPSSASNPVPSCRALLDDRGIVWPVRDQDPTKLTVVPAKGRNSQPPCRAGSPADWLAWCTAAAPSIREAHSPPR